MRNALVWFGTILAGLVILFSLIHIADAYLAQMLAVAVLLIGLGVASWPQP